jgi:hypothetical protein
MNTVDRAAVVLAFCDECVWLYSLRKHFTNLFESGERRQRLLAEVAETFFHDLNLVMIDYLLLQQCKLTDPASSGADKENLTTNYILGLNWTEGTANRLHAANLEIMKFRLGIDAARRKLIAHLDLRARLQAIDLGSFTPEEETSFWKSLQEFVDAAHEEAVGGPFDFKAAMPAGDVANLIHSLKDAVDYNDLHGQDGAFLLSRHGLRRFDDA